MVRIRLHSNNEKEFRKLYEEYYAPFCLYAKEIHKWYDSLWRPRFRRICFSGINDSIELKRQQPHDLKICVRNSCLNHLKHMEYEWTTIMPMVGFFIYATMSNRDNRLHLYETVYILWTNFMICYTNTATPSRKTTALYLSKASLKVKRMPKLHKIWILV